jgi:hypothetical protein|tara:strand:- start:2200 stop:3312 length:1113 start_codon:yes stop_codon:yes gene_type:complete
MAEIPVKEHGDLTFIINDARTGGDFKSETFSGYKRADVKKEFFNTLFNGKIEHACYWCAELVCSGQYMEIWEILILYLGKHICNANPKIAIYLQKRFQIFRNIMIQGTFYDEIELRNNKTIRELFTEVIVVLVSNPQKNGFELLKINKEDEFDMTKMTDRLKASSAEFALPIIHKKDPKEIFIAINEFVYNITADEDHRPNMIQACYWVEWIIEFDIICKKRKTKCMCERRYDISIEPKYQTDLIWVIWDAIFFVSNSTNNQFVQSILTAIRDLFCIKFTSACAKKRRHLLYFAVSLFCEPFRTDQVILSDKGFLQNTLNQLPNIYKQIKTKEIRPKTDYLFSGLEDKTNLEKSKQKLEWMNSIDMFYNK